MFAQVKPYLEKADITIANSESIIGGQEIGLSSYPQFNSPYEIGDVLKEVGVDVVNMANNHTLDRGKKLFKTLQIIGTNLELLILELRQVMMKRSKSKH